MGLTAPQTARLNALVANLLPARPPNEKWLAGGNDTIMHPAVRALRLLGLAQSAYTRKGFAKSTLSNGNLFFEKTLEGPKRANPPPDGHSVVPMT